MKLLNVCLTDFKRTICGKIVFLGLKNRAMIFFFNGCVPAYLCQSDNLMDLRSITLRTGEFPEQSEAGI